MNDEAKIPAPPKGVGISRRLLIALAGLILLLAILFLIFISQSSHRATQTQKTHADAANHSDKSTSFLSTQIL